jgi:hypothetical protein
MATPQWITPSGFLGTVVERVSTSTNLYVVDNTATTFSLISGSLPGGLGISSSGRISGTPFSVGQMITSQFVIRAANKDGITDRTFILDTSGPTDPIWLTPAGYLAIGAGGQQYMINKGYVDYQLSAIYDVLPAGQKLRYYIGDLEGELPPGLTLTEDGRIYGFITDTLGVDVLTSAIGGYDAETFDNYPYDHATIVAGGLVHQRPTFIAKLYQFYVTVTDSVASSRRLFQIKVEDPLSFRADTTLIDADTTIYDADVSYLITPQWLSPANLGYIRANNREVLQLSTYDPDPNTGPTTYDWDAPLVNMPITVNGVTTSTSNAISINPLLKSDRQKLIEQYKFTLDPDTGVIFGVIPYEPAVSKPYTFTVRLIKTDANTGETSFRDKTFTLTIKGNIENTLEFVTPSDLGALSPGYVSELAIVAKHTIGQVPVRYKIISGKLPNGLTLASDGTIVGRIQYNSQTYFDLELYGYGKFTLDHDATTVDATYRFTVEATDTYQQSISDREFVIKVVEYTVTEYVQMYIPPLMLPVQRKSFTDFITDAYTFEPALLYRPLDPEFGVQTTMKFTLEYGIRKEYLRMYAAQFTPLFREQRLLFNGIKTAVSKDSSGNVVYEVVYVELSDEFGNGISAIKQYLDITFPTDEYTMPNWMRTVQTSYGAPIGYVKAVSLCYTLPGMSDVILKRINLTGFDFKSLNFVADRILVSSTTDYADNKYLLFPNRISGGGSTTNIEEIILTVETSPLLAEDGSLLDLEL